jgi:hypothetical protein
MLTQISTADRLAAARRRLPDLDAAREYHAREVQNARALLVAAQLRARETAELALIENTEADPRAARAAEDAVAKLAQAESRYAIALGAYQRQSGIIAELEGEIRASRHLDRRLAAQPHWDAWVATQREAAEHLRKYLTAAEGEHLVISELSPEINPSVRDEMQRLSAASGAFLRVLAMFDPQLRKLLGWESAA